jgi:protein O-mannosyl-transferase
LAKTEKQKRSKSGSVKPLPPQPVAPLSSVLTVRNAAIVMGILLVTFFVYRNSLSNQLLFWDDNKYIIENESIRSLSAANISDMFTSYTMGDYSPLVTLSLALDYHFYGLKELSPNTFSGTGYHLTSLLIHLLSIVVLYFLCMVLSRSVFVSAFVAVLFAIHPMNVESVAWVTERKDQLYVLFYLSAMLSYLSYLEKSTKLKMVLTGIFFLLALLSKAMAATLPVVILLLDYFHNRKFDLQSLKVKLPFFILALVFAVVALKAQENHSQETGMIPGNNSPFTERVLFASYGLVNYVTKTIVPFEMSAYYPYPAKTRGSFPVMYYICLFVVIALMMLLWKLRKNKVLMFGSLFFLVNVALVLQLIPFGQSLMADRFTYLASIGLFFAGAVHLEKFFKEKEKWKAIFIMSGAAGFVVFLAFTAQKRTKDWQSTYTLWEDVTRKYPTAKVHEMCSGIFSRQGNYTGAILHMNRSIELDKKFTPRKYSYRSFLYYSAGQLDSSLADLNILLGWDQGTCSRARLLEHRGKIYLKLRDKEKALTDFQACLQLAQNCPDFNFQELNDDAMAAEALPD